MRLGLLRHPLGGGFDARALFAALHPSGDAFWLDSGPGGRAFLGTGERVALPAGGVLPRLRAELAALAVEGELGRVPLGLVGWLGYELRGETTGMPVRARGPHPDAAFLRVDRLVAVAGDGTAELLALGTAWEGGLAAWRDEVLAQLAAPSCGLSSPPQGAPSRWLSSPPQEGVSKPPAAPPPTWHDTSERYLANVRACQHAIHEGEAYQLCLTSEVRVPGAFDALAVFDALRATSATHHGALLRIGGTALVSASPERFLEAGPDGLVRTSPIKGTRPRDPRPDEDARLRGELVASDKERAENLMIVDLMRNDLSRVCALGTVAVTSLLEVESYPHVHQLVSSIEGRLLPGLGAVDAVAACFPAGSMTGAPKLRAIELLDALEDRPRGPYAGAFGYLAADGAADLAMTIRTIVIDAAGATVGTGGGITALSDPAAELAEARLKSAAPLAALAASHPLPSGQTL
ncbi:anthranilate synthase component I family protein [Protaetiibacter intestinalis]|uniref:Anthranilate synthase component I family protein n=1 Tax=Protaetiibacter intestinalis TaxID=2419774 RepID=A0A387B6Q7_9MICO|nr:anthranilate synthase component I family protein [Protaetiibacter intestinalis]AYF96885.1 anthranilate synthase component I family protein [Protaetiibacter intestinalis]